MIQIEADVPIPTVRVGRPQKYPFAAMRVGDSFALTGSMTAINVREAIRYFSKKTGRKFVVRKDSLKNTSRCWRTA